MEFQLRDYTIEEGRLDEFVREWQEHVLPLRVAMGFGVVGPWVVRDESRFVWIVGFDGDLAAANAAYYASPERAAIEPDPARLVAAARETRLETA